MSENPVPAHVLDQLRRNLQTAAIAFTEADIQGIIDKGFLDRVVAFEQIIDQTSMDAVPDHLKEWHHTAVTHNQKSTSSPIPSTGAAPVPSDSASTQTIVDIATLLQTRQISSLEITEQVLNRITQRDSTLNAYQLVLADEARVAAQQADTAIASGAYRGPLHGVPIAVKDLLAMRGTITTAGSKIHAQTVTDFDAAAVERLREAGAVIVGKTRLSEFAYSPGSNNAHYGPTCNLWNPKRDSGGSSSGSAVAVAAGMAYGALGTDTGGSIRIPATFCGLVGLKPTFGRISLYGATSLAWSLDHLGPITRSVGDAALLLNVLAGHDTRDIRTSPTPPIASSNIDGEVKGLRIGVLTDDGTGELPASPEAITAWQKGLTLLEQQGAHLIPLSVPEIHALRILHAAMLGLEASAYHLRYLRTLLDDYGEFMRQRVLAAFAYGAHAYMYVQQARGVFRQRCDRYFEQIDLLSTPAQPEGAPPLGTPAPTTFTGAFNILGWPAISVPVGVTTDQLPLGLQLVGKPWDEETVLRAARAIERMQSHV
ncbi:MAG: amidase [Chloroflexota bacterium]